MAEVDALAARRYSNKDIGAAVASGSFKTDGMVIAPCSIKTAAAVAHCVADTLMARAADVTLKEGRPLILLVRETPLHLGHLRVLTALAEMGRSILPPMPAFYHRPKQIDDLINHTLARVLDRLGIPQTLVPEWQGTLPRVPRSSAREARAPSRDAMTRALDLSIVVPVYNEEENLPLLWPEIREVLAPTGLAYEVIFVDDGSKDRSAEIVHAFRNEDPRVRLVRLKANAGETAATDAGLKSVRGRYVVVMDADLQNDPHDIPGMLSHLDQWDAVTGWRVNRAAGDSVVRRISSRVANRVRNRLSDETIQDSGCTFRAFRRECLRDLVLYKGFHRFIPTLLKMRGFRVLEVPVNHRPRRFGQSKYGIGNRAARAFVDLLVVRWMKDRLLRYEVAESLGGDGTSGR